MKNRKLNNLKQVINKINRTNCRYCNANEEMSMKNKTLFLILE